MCIQVPCVYLLSAASTVIRNIYYLYFLNIFNIFLCFGSSKTNADPKHRVRGTYFPTDTRTPVETLIAAVNQKLIYYLCSMQIAGLCREQEDSRLADSGCAEPGASLQRQGEVYSVHRMLSLCRRGIILFGFVPACYIRVYRYGTLSAHLRGY